MKTVAQLSLLCVIVAVMFGLPSSVCAGTLLDDFSDGNADGWTVLSEPASQWTIRDGGYHGEIAEGAEGVALIGESDWQVESIEVKIRDIQGDWLALIWRWQDVNNFDAWWININSKTLEAWPKIGAYEGAARTVQAIPLDAAKEQTFKVVITGDTFEAHFDGVPIGSYTSDKFQTGQVGLMVWNGSTTFDDVRITGPNVISGVTPVSPKGKLATLWGKLKDQ